MSYLENAQKLRSVIETAMDKVDDNTALEAPQLSKNWAAGETVKPGDRRYYAPTQKLYKVRDGQGHTTQTDWTPDVTPALLAVVSKGQTGTVDDPIDAARGMEYTYGLYYKAPDHGKTYLCKRTGEPSGGTIVLQYLPHELIGIYFDEVT